jgi:hypothetical protein
MAAPSGRIAGIERMKIKSRHGRALFLLLSVFMLPGALADPSSSSSDEHNVTELRNTVINLLQALVDKGVITREQADAMVKSAQAKAAAQAAEAAKQEKAEEGAVRVPYVPQIVKDEIAKQVAGELGPSVKQELIDETTSRGGLFAALPEWMQRITWTGDIRVRGESDIFAKDNAVGYYLDFNQVNSAGGISKAGPSALLNTTEDQNRLRLRVRFGLDAVLGSGFTAGVRLATGDTGEIVATTNQTLGTYGAGYTVSFDQAYIRWLGESYTGHQIFTATAGRFENPWVSTDLVWYNDLTFEGVVGNYRINLNDDNAVRHDLFATFGAFPLASFSVTNPNPSGEQKWLAGAQIGADLHTENESRFRFGAAYYDYIHIVGERNTLDSTLLNWSAPAFVQKGNTMFNISNTTDPTVNLFALASNFRIVDLISVGDVRVLPRYSVGYTVEALKNFGFNSTQVMERFGSYVAPRTRGYRADVSFGTNTFGPFATWRGSIGYRYLQRDAVLDAFNDEDFHLGGTDTKGYTILYDFSVNPHVWVRVKYMSANSIDGPPLGIDVLQLDLNSRF